MHKLRNLRDFPNTVLLNNGQRIEYTTPNKTLVGLGNVDNTSDANKPISGAVGAGMRYKDAYLLGTQPNSDFKLSDYTYADECFRDAINFIQTTNSNIRRLVWIGDGSFNSRVTLIDNIEIVFLEGSLKIRDGIRPLSIDGCFFGENLDSLTFIGTSNFVFDGNLDVNGVTDNSGGGYLFENFINLRSCTNIVIDGIHSRRTFSNDINLSGDCVNVLIQNCLIQDGFGDSGIHVSNATAGSNLHENVTIRDNVILGMSGIKIRKIRNFDVFNNVCIPNGGGFKIPGVEYTDWGVNVNIAEYGNISNNKISNCKNDLSNLSYGIQILDSNSCHVHSNAISNCENIAIRVIRGTNNIIAHNTFRDNRRNATSSYNTVLSLEDTIFNSIEANQFAQYGATFANSAINIDATSTDNRCHNNIFRFFPNNILGTFVTDYYQRVNAMQTPPATATSPGSTGELRITANAIYVCTAPNTWKKTDLNTF